MSIVKINLHDRLHEAFLAGQKREALSTALMTYALNQSGDSRKDKVFIIAIVDILQSLVLHLEKSTLNADRLTENYHDMLTAYNKILSKLENESV